SRCRCRSETARIRSSGRWLDKMSKALAASEKLVGSSRLNALATLAAASAKAVVMCSAMRSAFWLNRKTSQAIALSAQHHRLAMLTHPGGTPRGLLLPSCFLETFLQEAYADSKVRPGPRARYAVNFAYQ